MTAALRDLWPVPGVPALHFAYPRTMIIRLCTLAAHDHVRLVANVRPRLSKDAPVCKDARRTNRAGAREAGAASGRLNEVRLEYYPLTKAECRQSRTTVRRPSAGR
jgi:hypothetical protein